MSQTVGIVFSGSGYLDGTEIQEATLALYFLDKLYAALRPDIPEPIIANFIIEDYIYFLL